MKVAMIASAALLLTLGACASSEELATRDHQSCSSYGFNPGTDAYAQCRMQMSRDRDAAFSRFLAQQNQLNRQQLQQNQATTQQLLRPANPLVRQPVTTNCRRDMMGNVTCETY